MLELHGDKVFSLGYLGQPIVVISLDKTNLLKLIQVFADKELRYIKS